MPVDAVQLQFSDRPFIDVIADGERYRDAVASVGAVTRAETHLLWAQDAALQLIVEGDNTIDEIVYALRLATSATSISYSHVGESAWTSSPAERRMRAIGMAIGPGGVRCESCDEYVPEHGDRCLLAGAGAIAAIRGSGGQFRLIGPAGAAATPEQTADFRAIAANAMESGGQATAGA